VILEGEIADMSAVGLRGRNNTLMHVMAGSGTVHFPVSSRPWMLRQVPCLRQDDVYLRMAAGRIRADICGF
jgi:hypothetical protein